MTFHSIWLYAQVNGISVYTSMCFLKFLPYSANIRWRIGPIRPKKVAFRNISFYGLDFLNGWWALIIGSNENSWREYVYIDSFDTWSWPNLAKMAKISQNMTIYEIFNTPSNRGLGLFVFQKCFLVISCLIFISLP